MSKAIQVCLINLDGLDNVHGWKEYRLDRFMHTLDFNEPFFKSSEWSDQVHVRGAKMDEFLDTIAEETLNVAF